MRARTRILEPAMHVFRRHGFRRSSIEQAAEAAGLTRQALYHHFKSKEALFRALLELASEGALAAEITAADAAENGVQQDRVVLRREPGQQRRHLVASLEGSPH